MNTLSNETIHITFECTVHLHGHRDKMVPLVKTSIIPDFSNGVKFHNCSCWLSNDTHSHHLPCQIHNHHINNKNLVLTNHVRLVHNEVPDIKAYHCFLHTSCPLSWVKVYMTSLMASCVVICWPPNGQCVKCLPNAYNPYPHSHMKKLDVKGWIKLRHKCNLEVKVECAMWNEQINGLVINHSLVPWPEQEQMLALKAKNMESSFKIDLRMCCDRCPSKMLVNLGHW
jgi:hypothetical protein